MSSKKDNKTKEKYATLSYQLSNDKFIKNSWTKLPSYKECGMGFKLFDTKPWGCFKKKTEAKIIYYPKAASLRVAAMYRQDGSGEIYYPDGKIAIKLADHPAIGQRVLLYGKYSGNDSEPVRSFSVTHGKKLGWFDSKGNCSIFDENGKVLVNYDQMGGIVHNYNSTNRYFYWQWCNDVILRFKKIPEHHISILSDQSAEDDKNTIATRESKNSNSFNDVQLNNKKSSKKCARISTELLKNTIVNRYRNVSLLETSRKHDAFQCKINDCISLWIGYQEKIELCFASDGIIQRLDVGVQIDGDFLKHRCNSLCVNLYKFPNFNDSRVLEKISRAQLPPKSPKS